MSCDQREQLVYNAKLAEQAERYDEMADFMKAVAQMNKPLSVEERNQLSVAYKNAVGARRASWRVVSSAETKQKNKGNEKYMQIAGTYRKKVEEELSKISNDIISILDNNLLETPTDAETKVFYLKMKGDYYRYISEYSADTVRKDAVEKANISYEEATKISSAELPTTNPVRLGLSLNYSVFYYEILKRYAEACQMASKAMDEAVRDLERLPQEHYRDSTLIIQLLRDNLTLWTSDASLDSGAQAVPGQPEQVPLNVEGTTEESLTAVTDSTAAPSKDTTKR